MAESVTQDQGLKNLDWTKSRLRVAFLIKIIIWILNLVLTWYTFSIDLHEKLELLNEKDGFPIKIFYGAMALFFGTLSVGSIIATGFYLGIRECFRHQNPYLFAGIRLGIFWTLWLIFDTMVS